MNTDKFWDMKELMLLTYQLHGGKSVGMPQPYLNVRDAVFPVDAKYAAEGPLVELGKFVDVLPA